MERQSSCKDLQANTSFDFWNRGPTALIFKRAKIHFLATANLLHKCSLYTKKKRRVVRQNAIEWSRLLGAVKLVGGILGAVDKPRGLGSVALLEQGPEADIASRGVLARDRGVQGFTVFVVLRRGAN